MACHPLTWRPALRFALASVAFKLETGGTVTARRLRNPIGREEKCPHWAGSCEHRLKNWLR